MPRTEAANERVREAQRARILEGARAAFARRGLAATMAEVADAAGVSQGLAYRYFASKDELIRAVVADAMRAAPDTDPRIESLTAPGQRIDALIGTIVEARRTRRELFQLMHHVATDPETPEDLLALMRRRGGAFVKVLRQLIVEAQAAGDVAAGDPDELVSAMVACLDGLTRLPRNHPDGTSARFPGPEIILRLLRPPVRREDA